MASQCKRQQCTIDRRGFRQELDSWRHKLIHCVGFESILDGLFGPELVQDLKLFKDLEPTTVSDWSFDENCLFCCLRRDKVKEHLIGLSYEGLEDPPKPLQIRDQTTISRLEKQAEEFLHAVLNRKDVPNFADPHIPVVAREILQRMIKQFAAEYTSKTSPSQDSCSDSQPLSDQSLPTAPSISGAPPSTSPAPSQTGPVHSQNPVLSKLLMADQDAPLDLTIKKPLAVPSDQDGVLDLSIKKNRYSSTLPVRSPCLSPASPMIKGRSCRADGQVGLFMKSLQDGRRRENIGHSNRYKPSSSLAYSLHIKEEADLESDTESPLSHNHSSRTSDLFKNGSASWNSKKSFGALLKLKTNSEASEHLKDIPRLLEAAGLLSKSLAYEKGHFQEACKDLSLSPSRSSSYDLKIPQVRVLASGTDPSWDFLSTEYSGSVGENGLGKTLRSILPRQIQKKSSGGLSSSGSEKEYWPYDTDRQAFGGNYPLDSESDLGNKQPRKKRGRYRQYNTELLEEAIVVVMGGKMSVSKAQSIYGIPHSTLEYKVKERLGTLKHPPKKKLKLISRVEGEDVPRSLERQELQNSQHIVSGKRESASDENGNDSHDGSLSSNDESQDFHVTKAKDLQSTSTLEQFMAKLCPHHQRQIVDAIGFLQTEVKAFASSNMQQDSISTSGAQGITCSTPKPSLVTPEKSFPALTSTPKSEVQDMPQTIRGICASVKVPEKMVPLKTSGPALDLRSPGSGSNQAPVTPGASPADNSRHVDHAPLKMKIMTSNVAAGKRLSCVLNTSLSSHSDTLEEKELNVNSSSRTETHSARLSSSTKRHNQSSSTQQARQRETTRHAKDSPTKLYSVHMTIPPDSPRTARKTIRASSDHRDSAYRGIVDPDLGHCDIVFIDKPITECFKERQSSMVPRRNARKSTRGHIYCDEIWELKTVRTLAGRGNCPQPMPELTTLVTPKQMLSKPEGVPPVDMPFAGACRETMIQQMSTEQSDEGVIPGAGEMVEEAASEVDIVVETSQTDQCQSMVQSVPSSPKRISEESKETDLSTRVEEEMSADLGITTVCEDSFDQGYADAEKDREPEPAEETCESSTQIVETVMKPLESNVLGEDESQSQSDKPLCTESILEQPSTPIQLNQVEEETEAQGSREEEIQDEEPQEMQPETQTQDDKVEVTETSQTTDSTDELLMKESENKTSETPDSVLPLETENNNNADTVYDVSSKTLDALLKELPPWRRRKGAVVTPPKWFKRSEAVVVGYVYGKPVSSSDRSLRRRPGNSTSPSRTPVKSKNVPNKNTVDKTLESTTGDKNQEEHLLETHLTAEPAEKTPEASPVKEQTPTTSSPSSKVPSRSKQISKQKKILRDQDSLPVLADQPSDGAQSSEPRRQLRSGSQKPAEPQVSAPTPGPVPSDESPKPAATHSPTTVEQTPSLPSTLPPPTPPITAPEVSSSPPAATEQSEQITAQEATEEPHIEEPQPAETTSEEIKEDNVENGPQAKQKLSSAKAVVDDSENEKEQQRVEESSQSESQSPVKTETQPQTVPVKIKRVHRNEVEALLLDQPNVAFLQVRSASEDDSSSDKPTRMPLRSKVGMSHQSVTQIPVDDKKLTLRSQRLASPPSSSVTVAGRQSEVTSPIRKLPERINKAQVKSPSVSDVSGVPHSSANLVITPRPEPPKQANKFLQALTGEDNQQLISNLNMRYDKMQRGWVQMDKEGQPAIKHKNKADRQAAIWKSKRRSKKPKSLEHQKYSPVQMLFMKGFNLTSICRWFLESTETKSLVIVKKVNTRLPSETQLCFHSSSASGTSQGVFPSLQAERLKKHLKKFAIASPVKSNPKSQKLIAKALEQEPNAVKGKEKRELLSTPQILNKAHSSTEARAQTAESQKSSSKPKNPASARILRKYSNIREKMQVQQTNARLKKASTNLKNNSLKRLAAAKSTAKSIMKPSLKAQKPSLPVSKQTKAAKIEKKKTLAEKKPTKPPVQAVKAPSSVKASREPVKKEVPKRSSLRLGSPKAPEHTVEMSKSKVDIKKQIESEKIEVEKPTVNKMNASRVQTKESSQSTVTEVKGADSAVETPQQGPVPASPDQVLTRSQRKMEAVVPPSGSKSQDLKKTTKLIKTPNAPPKPVRNAETPTLTRSGALRESLKRSHAASPPRSSNKATTKKAEQLLETPAKRTRTSLAK